MKAIKRISREFCEDAFDNGILYVEARFCPHLMLSEKSPEVTAKDVVETVLEGFKESEEKFGLKVSTGWKEKMDLSLINLPF